MGKRATVRAGAAWLLALLLAPGPHAETTVGTIVAVDEQRLTLRADDGALCHFALSPEVRVVSPSHYEIRASDLVPGQRVQVLSPDVQPDATGGATSPTAQGILVVRENPPDDPR